jgi:peptidoglycan/LPS O-acetylase OafA/YrhL
VNVLVSKDAASGYFPNLDGWRFVAFFIVFISHGPGLLIQKVTWPSALTFLKIPITKMLDGGGVGVAFFFVLSGFLITYLILREVEKNGRLDLLRFYMRRTLRIWPLYYAVIAFGLIIYPALKQAVGFSEYIQAGRPLYYWAFLSNLNGIALGPRHSAMLGVTWSVAVEEQFYLVWPLLFLLVPRRAYGLIFPSAMLASLYFRSQQTEPLVLNTHTFSVIGDLALGGGLAYLVLSWPPLLVWLRKLSRGHITTLYIVGFLVVFYQDAWSVWRPMLIVARLLCGLVFGFIILEQNFATNSPFKMSSFKWMTKWGTVTYGLYLLHEIAIQFASVGLRILHRDPNSVFGLCAITIISFVLSLIMARMSYAWFEGPFLRLKDRFKPKASALLSTAEAASAGTAPAPRTPPSESA